MCIPFPRKSKPALAVLLFLMAGAACVQASQDAAAQAVIVSPNIVRDARYTLRVYVSGHEVTENMTLKEGVNTIRRSYDSHLGGKVTVIHDVVLDTVAPEIEITDAPKHTDKDTVVIKGKADGRGFSQTHPFIVPPGEAPIVVRVTDRAGNASETSVRVIKDKKKPLPKPLAFLSKPARAPEPTPPTEPLILTGDYALIIEMTDGSGGASSQLLKAAQRPAPVPVIFRGVIKKVVYVYYRVVKQETPEGAQEKVKAVFAAFDARPRARSYMPDSGALVSGEGPAPDARPDGARTALVSLEAGPLKVVHGVDASAIGVIEAPVRAGGGPAVKTKPEDKQVAAKLPAADASPEPAAEEIPTEPAADGEKGLSYTQTHVRIPDEFGGMTITRDNYKTGEHVVIRKDQSGNEIERLVTKIPEQAKPKPVKTEEIA